MTQRIDPLKIHDNALLFAGMTAQVLFDMIGYTCTIDHESSSEESFVRLEGIAVLIHFGGSIQGDYILHFSRETASAILGRTSMPFGEDEESFFEEEVAGFFPELLNSAVGQTIHRLEENLGILSYVPAVTILGSVHFPRVLSRSFLIAGSAGPVRCILSLNMGDLRIARRLDEMRESLEITTRQSHVDRLTQLYNRSYYDEVYAAQVAGVERYGNILSLMIIDIDFFKQVNDTYGHQIGDVVLAVVGGTVKRIVRKCDIPVRYGGDEICVIMPETDAAGARRVAERIVEALSTRSVECVKDGVTIAIAVSLSIGLAQHLPGEGADGLFARTDALLYRAKGEGRGRIVSSADPDAPLSSGSRR